MKAWIDRFEAALDGKLPGWTFERADGGAFIGCWIGPDSKAMTANRYVVFNHDPDHLAAAWIAQATGRVHASPSI